MPVVVWVPELTLTCCGSVFGVGDSVDWHVADPESDSLETVLPRDVAQRISLVENSHGASDDTSRSTHGTVLEIHAAFVGYAGSGVGGVLSPVPGTAFLREVAHVEETATGGPGVRLSGYVVTLDVQPSPG
ncbi:DUF6578 domain-containing protein [Cellulomonas fimi]|uniref:DUF6578 domain-containing protein n=1 Tax=Cellulomonas fimi TaxID=1708 RepID=UPI000F837F1E|nr:DUF6578 domain-containing protein [Cellulomonas fimi]NNH06435.1 hypothetical protein [Cellulomonas fimi]